MTPTEAYNNLQDLIERLDLLRKEDKEAYIFRVETLRLLAGAINKAYDMAGGISVWSLIEGNIYDQEDLMVLLDNKQGLLVSGSTIKTINGESLLGSGNIEILVPEATFTNDITVALSGGKTLGKYENGDTIPSAGKTFEEVMNLIAQETIYPTFVNPTFSLSWSSSPSSTYEVGTNYSNTLNGNFNRGLIKGDFVGAVWDPNATQDYRAGAATSYTLNGTNQPGSSIAVNRVLTQGTNAFAGSVAYATGPQPLDSSGANYDSPYPSGTINGTALNITARYKTFYGATATGATDSAAVRALSSSTWENVNSFTTGIFNQVKFVIAIPATKNLVSVVTANNENITANFVLSTFNVNDAAGNPVSYKVYTFTSVTPLNLTSTVTLS